MKIYIINLEQDEEKKLALTSQLKDQGVFDYEVIKAVNGRALSDKYVKDNVYDYAHSQLTLGEVGCALSHYGIYQKMLQEDISSALILEDDVVLRADFNVLISNLTANMDVPESKILSLGESDKIIFYENAYIIGEYQEALAVSAYGGYAYCINLAAAKNLVKHLLPIKYEADMFRYFRENGWIESFNVIYPQVVKIVSNHDDISNIHAERYPLIQARKKYRVKHILNKRPFWVRVKARLQRIFWKFKQIKVDR